MYWSGNVWKLLDSGEAGDNIGALLRGVERDDVERGQVLCKWFYCTHRVRKSAYIKKEEGGRHTPFLQNIDHSFTLELQM